MTYDHLYSAPCLVWAYQHKELITIKHWDWVITTWGIYANLPSNIIVRLSQPGDNQGQETFLACPVDKQICNYATLGHFTDGETASLTQD